MKRWPDHYYFCTYFDQNYLARGLLLCESLMEHVPSFTLYVLALDDVAYDIIIAKSFSNIVPIHLRDLEKYDSELLATKSTRSLIEYYFTCSPCFPLYVLTKNPAIDILTYIDADIYFYDSPRPFYEELGNNSILVFEHGISPIEEERHGRFNVGYLSWRSDETGLACLRWWRDRCIEWCFDRIENGKFADQKYLDQWPILFKPTIISKQTARALAPWNVERYRVTYRRGKPVNLILFHFHGLRLLSRRRYTICNAYNPSASDIDKLFNVYVRKLVRLSAKYTTTIKHNMRIGLFDSNAAVVFLTVPLLSKLIWNWTKYWTKSRNQGKKFVCSYQIGALQNPVRESMKILFRYPLLIINRHILIGILARHIRNSINNHSHKS